MDKTKENNKQVWVGGSGQSPVQGAGTRRGVSWNGERHGEKARVWLKFTDRGQGTAKVR